MLIILLFLLVLFITNKCFLGPKTQKNGTHNLTNTLTDLNLEHGIGPFQFCVALPVHVF